MCPDCICLTCLFCPRAQVLLEEGGSAEKLPSGGFTVTDQMLSCQRIQDKKKKKKRKKPSHFPDKGRVSAGLNLPEFKVTCPPNPSPGFPSPPLHSHTGPFSASTNKSWLKVRETVRKHLHREGGDIILTLFLEKVS